MPAPVYARGFVRNLARILDLEEEPLLALMDQGGVAAPAVTQANEAIGHVAAATREAGMLGRIPPTWWAASAGVLVVGVLVGVGIRGCVRSMAANAARQVPPSPFQSRQEAGKPVTQASRKSAPAEALAPSEAAAVRVSVTAFQECWMDTQIDDQKPVQVEMKPGDEMVFEASTRVRLYIGNPSGVRIIGPRVKLRAKAGRTEHLLFYADHMERIKAPVPVSATEGL
jgi:cytoskeletal protein RodZ